MRTIQSFVKRSGRLTKSQQNALESYGDNFYIKNFDKIWNNNNPTILEVGFGNGDSLLTMAKNEPDNNFIGVEVYEAGVGRLLNNAQTINLTNLKVINDDVMVILEKIPNNFLSGFQLYFPDPWHKKKHHKRRIIRYDFLDILLSKLKNDAFVHMATDWEDYAVEMLEVLTKHQNLINTTINFSKKPARRPTTKFEQRGIKLGHQVWDLVFKVKK